MVQAEDYIAPFRVHARNNQGHDWHVWAASLDTAKIIAKGNRHSGNHMVCIEESGERMLRWDRDKIGGENRWRKVDVDALETFGIVRKVVRRGR
ncbi:type IV pilus biogenesis protein PilI [Acidithiobacillus ferridurans]|uniref:Plasmid conjugative transfer protein PilI domain-containing protein n=1 Tax=Acidithiobacillus ferridurans TaxID=1232575 RepID=A0A8X8KB51_ACIFI|nr:hypothetical protein [Acidithiobacillus ferridurans]MBU2715840.1 hypothetical protein [Acidithiobacillus ferridurans]MBU2722837.1 hypothetical protein [Acidithiobacillus ferridurans]MBU2727776.1 hypothetical protein [Acidithiobacillus ferridurans]